MTKNHHGSVGSCEGRSTATSLSGEPPIVQVESPLTLRRVLQSEPPFAFIARRGDLLQNSGYLPAQTTCAGPLLSGRNVARGAFAFTHWFRNSLSNTPAIYRASVAPDFNFGSSTESRSARQTCLGGVDETVSSRRTKSRSFMLVRVQPDPRRICARPAISFGPEVNHPDSIRPSDPLVRMSDASGPKL
jgi:hypothetical protein